MNIWALVQSQNQSTLWYERSFFKTLKTMRFKEVSTLPFKGAHHKANWVISGKYKSIIPLRFEKNT